MLFVDSSITALWVNASADLRFGDPGQCVPHPSACWRSLAEPNQGAIEDLAKAQKQQHLSDLWAHGTETSDLDDKRQFGFRRCRDVASFSCRPGHSSAVLCIPATVLVFFLRPLPPGLRSVFWANFFLGPSILSSVNPSRCLTGIWHRRTFSSAPCWLQLETSPSGLPPGALPLMSLPGAPRALLSPLQRFPPSSDSPAAALLPL